MQAFNIDNDNFIIVDETLKPKIINYTNKQREKIRLESDIAELPDIDDAYLLQWAKDHYQEVEGVKLKNALKDHLKIIEDIIKEIEKVKT